ncbi:MAG: hypothetical protein GY803_13090 [Chloroflexi bacterium]|nr:hypothetical protein [Chloroflexota bacterium]
MKKLFAFALFFLTACGSATNEVTVNVPSIGDAEPATVAPVPDDAAAVPTDEGAAAPTVVESLASDAFSPATAVSEAAVIRSQDHVIGAEDPAVAIIEYGDYQ